MADDIVTGVDEISIEHGVPPAKLEVLGVDDWPVWSSEKSTFDWTYQVAETCYIIDGEAIVTPHDGRPVTITRGDLVTFPGGMSCIWEVVSPISKHYRLLSM